MIYNIIIKEQTRNDIPRYDNINTFHKNKGRRYTGEFNQIALTIVWFFGTKVYTFLKSTWYLSNNQNLQRVSEVKNQQRFQQLCI